jgi:hypothetical protein
MVTGVASEKPANQSGNQSGNQSAEGNGTGAVSQMSNLPGFITPFGSNTRFIAAM